MLRLALYLAYIYYRKLFPKGDLLTMGLLLGVLCYALLALYQHYETWHYALWSLPLSTFAYHNTRKDISLLKAHSHYRAILIAEYVVESLPFFILMLLKNDFSTAVGVLLLFVLISCLPQKNFTLKYPFSLTDPTWHIAFRKYKLIIALPLTIAFVIIGRIYENPNVALFALGAMAFTACVPYFEREFSPHIAVANHKGEMYLREQLKAGLLNTIILFAPLIITYFIGFGTQNIAILPLFVAFPILGVITKYAFWENPLWQFFALAAISAGVIYIIPLIAIPYFYYLAIQKIKNYNMLEILIQEKYYSDRKILENIQLSIPKNGLYGVVGKNGAGKTTFFKCLSGLTPFKGEVHYCERGLMPEDIGFLPTEPYLYEHLTVAEFYTFFRLLLGIKPEEAMPFEVDKTLLIRELSTGMRKKVYCNAVLQKPYTLYIFDEPFNGLDITSVLQIKQLLNKLAANHIVLIASHILETLQTCEKIYLIHDRSIQTFLPSELNAIEEFLIS